MTTPNIEELIAELQQLANEIEISYRIESIEEAVKALQSQAERIAELERESETHSKAYGLAIVERDNLRHELKVAQEGWRCECSTDDACRFARERDALRAQLAEIAATEPSMIYHGRCVIDCGDSGHQDVTEFDESQFKSVEDLIAHLNKLNSYRDRTLEALSKCKGAK